MQMSFTSGRAFFFALLVTLLAAAAGQALPMVGEIRHRTVKGSIVRVSAFLRKAPSPKGKVVAGIPGGYRVVVDPKKSKGFWYAVRVIDFPPASAVGFVPKKDVRLIDMKLPFQDVHEDHWAYGSISELAREGLVQGYGGYYFGKRAMTRDEMAAIIARLVRRLRKVQASLIGRLESLSNKLDRGRATGGITGAGAGRASHGPCPAEGKLKAVTEQLGVLSGRLEALAKKVDGLKGVGARKGPSPPAAGHGACPSRRDLDLLKSRLVDLGMKLEVYGSSGDDGPKSSVAVPGRIDGKQEAISRRLDGLSKRFDGLAQRSEALRSRVQKLSSTKLSIAHTGCPAADEIAKIKATMRIRFRVLQRSLGTAMLNRQSFERMEARLTAVEKRLQ